MLFLPLPMCDVVILNYSRPQKIDILRHLHV